MSYEYPITIKTNIRTKQQFREINFNVIIKEYSIYLRKLVFKMISDDKNKRPNANDAFDELEVIELFMNNSRNKILKKCLDELNKSLDNYQYFKDEVNNNIQNQNNSSFGEKYFDNVVWNNPHYYGN